MSRARGLGHTDMSRGMYDMKTTEEGRRQKGKKGAEGESDQIQIRRPDTKTEENRGRQWWRRPSAACNDEALESD